LADFHDRIPSKRKPGKSRANTKKTVTRSHASRTSVSPPPTIRKKLGKNLSFTEERPPLFEGELFDEEPRKSL